MPNLKKNGILLSGILLENMSQTAWQRLVDGGSQVNASASNAFAGEKPDPLRDTSLRRFKRGTVLRFGAELYNAKLPSLQQSKINMQARVFHDRLLVFESKETPLNLDGRSNGARLHRRNRARPRPSSGRLRASNRRHRRPCKR